MPHLLDRQQSQLIPGIFAVPHSPSRYFRYKGIKLKASVPAVHPANAIKCHQSQGGTISRVVALLDSSTERYYGMAKVAISRRPKIVDFSLAERVSKCRMHPKPRVLALVAQE